MEGYDLSFLPVVKEHMGRKKSEGWTNTVHTERICSAMLHHLWNMHPPPPIYWDCVWCCIYLVMCTWKAWVYITRHAPAQPHAVGKGIMCWMVLKFGFSCLNINLLLVVCKHVLYPNNFPVCHSIFGTSKVGMHSYLEDTTPGILPLNMPCDWSKCV